MIEGQFIAEFWLKWAFGLLAGAFGIGYRVLKKKIDKREEEQKALKCAMLAILHDKLFESCSYYLKLSHIPLEDAEEILDNMRIIYESYKALGGNGTGENIYKKFLSLKIKE